MVELQEPPHSFLTPPLVEEVATALQEASRDPSIGCAVLAAQGRSFCAGANFGGGGSHFRGRELIGSGGTERLYAAAARLCSIGIPIVAAVHGPAIGGGLGLAMTANTRVTCAEARFCANFAALGIRQGFGLSVTLPDLIGPSRAPMVLLTAHRFDGQVATRLGMADVCVAADQVRGTALEIAAEIAANAPLAVRSINKTLREGLAERVRRATRLEAAEQGRLGTTADAAEGIRAVFGRRPGRLTGR